MMPGTVRRSIVGIVIAAASPAGVGSAAAMPTTPTRPATPIVRVVAAAPLPCHPAGVLKTPSGRVYGVEVCADGKEYLFPLT